MSSNSTNATKNMLAQLSLAGAATLASATANAQITYTALNQNVGAANSSRATIDLGSGIRIYVGPNDGAITLSGSFNYAQHVGVHGTGTKVTSPGGALYRSSIAISPDGEKFGSVAGPNIPDGFLLVPGGTPPTNSDNYVLFEFNQAVFSFVSYPRFVVGPPEYGWIEFAVTDDTTANYNVNLIGYAIDTSGAQIAAGAGGPAPASVPEPSAAMALAAISALALGAAGIKRMKALQN